MKARFELKDTVYSLDDDQPTQMIVEGIIDDPDVVAEVTYICEWNGRDSEDDNYFLQSQLTDSLDLWSIRHNVMVINEYRKLVGQFVI